MVLHCPCNPFHAHCKPWSRAKIIESQEPLQQNFDKQTPPMKSCCIHLNTWKTMKRRNQTQSVENFESMCLYPPAFEIQEQQWCNLRGVIRFCLEQLVLALQEASNFLEVIWVDWLVQCKYLEGTKQRLLSSSHRNNSRCKIVVQSPCQAPKQTSCSMCLQSQLCLQLHDPLPY